MCEYCEVRMPDARGMEMDGKHGLMQILIGNSEYVSIGADRLSIPSVRDVFKFNYCPMCGKKLGESDDESMKWLVEVDGNILWFNKEHAAIERCEGEAKDGYIANLYRVRIENKRTCQMAIMPVWD